MTLLSVVQRASDLLSVSRPAAVVSSTDNRVRQLYAIACEILEELGRKPWQELRREQTFATVAAAEQTAALPDDFDGFVDRSAYNRTTRRPLIGPLTPDQWQAVQAQPAYNRVFLAWIQRDGAFLVTPTPGAGETIAYEYWTVNRASDLSGAEKETYTADTDAALLDERIIRLGVVARFKQENGFDYLKDEDTYLRRVDEALGRQGGAAVVHLGGGGFRLPPVNLPDGNWPGAA